jgi:fucose permease
MYNRSIMASFHGLWSVGGFAGAVVGTLAVSSGLSILSHFTLVWVSTAILSIAAYKFAVPGQVEDGTPAPLFARPDRKLWILGIIAFCCLVCEGAMADWSGVYFSKVVETPAAYATFGYVAFTATMALGRFVGDALANKLGIRRMLAFSGILTFVGLAIAVLLPDIVTAIIQFNNHDHQFKNAKENITLPPGYACIVSCKSE